MTTLYRVEAYSLHLNQTQQRIDLGNDPLLADEAYAQRVAESFAQQLNQQFHQHTADWSARTTAYEHYDLPPLTIIGGLG